MNQKQELLPCTVSSIALVYWTGHEKYMIENTDYVLASLSKAEFLFHPYFTHEEAVLVLHFPSSDSRSGC